MLADCDRCALRDIACAECVITVLPDGQAGLGDEERRALRALAAAGLVPPLRFRPAQASTVPGAQADTAPRAQALDFAAAPACSAGPSGPSGSSGPSGPVTGARSGPRRPATHRSAARPGRQPIPSHR